MNSKLKKSISEIEGWSWKSEIPDKDNSSFEEYNFYKLHNKSIADYSLEDLHFMIIQGSGLTTLVPLAIDEIHKDLFVEAEDFPGDLLHSLMAIKKDFWSSNPELYKKLSKLVVANRDKIENFEAISDIKNLLNKTLNDFLKNGM